ncbi:MAG: phosphodiester glycosidase family protein [Ruminococcaceae bacterium]|nr:phosphodiester glycosidase family protein [Oscillospiraceae bacterium]
MISFFKRKYVCAVIFSVVLISFTLFMVLDTFVIEKIYQTVPPINQETSETESGSEGKQSDTKPEKNDSENENESQSENSGAVLTENSYKDENISITITTHREYNTEIYVADIKLSSPEYLKTAFAKNAYGRNVTAKTSSTAKNVNAILAINGDYYGAQEKGYVIRNNVLYRDTVSRDNEDLVIYNDGSFGIIRETEISADELLKQGAREVLSFGPALIENGVISVDKNDEVGQAMASNPRTAIGIVEENHYIFVVSDGRTRESEGLTLLELAKFMQSLSANTAYNLDGGGSATMVFNGDIVNKPTTNGKTIKERSVSDIVYIG